MDYDIDVSASTLLINMNYQSPNTCMPREDFRSLSPEVREIWSKIPNDMKAFMLRSRTGNSNERINKNIKYDYKTAKPPSFLHRKFIKANVHKIITELISETSFTEKNEADTLEDEPYSESTLLVNFNSANTFNPGEIRKLISALRKIKAISNKKQTAFSNEITMNGKTYRECSQHTTCCI